MNTIDLISQRRSVRTFDGRDFAEEDASKILKYAREAVNPYGSPIEWKILDAVKDGLSSPVIAGTAAYIAGKMKKGPHAEEAFGYSFEKVVLFAQSLGIGTTWIAGTMDRKAFEKAMNVAEDEVMPAEVPWANRRKRCRCGKR